MDVKVIITRFVKKPCKRLNMIASLLEGKKKLAVIGLGYVGLPIALELARKMNVIGFDIKPDRVSLMKKGIDPSNEISSEAFKACDITFTSDPDDLAAASFFIVAVPTPIDDHKQPDLGPLLSACKTFCLLICRFDFCTLIFDISPIVPATDTAGEALSDH